MRREERHRRGTCGREKSDTTVTTRMRKIKRSCKSRNKYSVAVAILRYIAVTLGERCGPSPVSFFSAAVDAIENDNFSTCEMTEAERRGIDCLLRVAQHSACDSDNDASGTC